MVLQPGRWTAELDGDFVVFLIGAAVHDPAVAAEVGGLLMAMVDMLDELEADPSKGLLGYTRHGDPGSGVLVQYWRSFDALEAYARNPDARHAPVWRAWNRLGSDERGGAGIWHETFKVELRQLRSDLPEHASDGPAEGRSTDHRDRGQGLCPGPLVELSLRASRFMMSICFGRGRLAVGA